MPAWMRIMLATGLCFAAGAIAALYITPRTFNWYGSVQMPEFFAIPLPVLFFVLVVTYALLAIASSLMWIHDPRQWDFRGWMPLFFTHLLVSTAWLILFFSYNVVFLALILVFILAVYVLILTAAAWQRSVIAFWLMIPYLAVVLYFLGMNMAVWLAN